MWTITDKEIAAIAKAIEKEAKKIANKYTSSDKSDYVHDDGANNRNEEVGNDEIKSNHSNSENRAKKENTTSDSEQGKQSNEENVNSSLDTSKVIQSCPLIEVEAVIEVIGTANNKQFEATVIYKDNKGKEIEKNLENQIINVDVFSQIKFTAKCPKDKHVEWYLKKGTKEKTILTSVSEIIGNSETKKVNGNEIKFPIPKEWGKKSYTIIALCKELNVERTIQISVRDHIAAAFFRLDTRNSENSDITIQKKLKGTPLKDLYHHQGMYKEKETFYVSVSTLPRTPSHIYISGGDKKEHILLDQGVLKEYTHPGGVQVADGLLAVGLESYIPYFPVTTELFSIICFFDLNEGNIELTDIRLILDEKHASICKTSEDKKVLSKPQNQNLKNNRASALGIVKRKGEFIVANRGTGSNIDFYKISTDKKTITKLGETINNVGDFQNINLFTDEKNNLYLFGMGNENGEKGGITHVYHVFDSSYDMDDIGNFDDFDSNSYKEFRKRDKDVYFNLENLNIPYGESSLVNYFSVYGTYHYSDFYKKVTVYKYPIADTEIVPHNVCRIFKVDNIESSPTLESVWIDKDGLLKTQGYNLGEVDNKLRFYCGEGTDPRFHWASCLSLNGIEEEGSEFKGHFTLYAVGAGVSNKKIPSICFKEKEE